MVLMLALRCMRHCRRGLQAREAALAGIRADVHHERAAATSAAASAPAKRAGDGGNGEEEKEVRRRFAAKCLSERDVTTAYCGLHTIDMAGHVNNAKYLELLEYGRWHQLAMQGMNDFVRKEKGIFVVSDLSIQYVREIRPFATVQITTQCLPASDRPAQAGSADTAAADSPAGGGGPDSTQKVSPTAPPSSPLATRWDGNSGNNKRILVAQAIWSADGSTLHAAAVMQGAFLAPSACAQRLEAAYGLRQEQQAAAGSPAQRAGRVTLDCHRVIADCTGVPVRDVEGFLYDARETFLVSIPTDPAATTGNPQPAQWLTDMTRASNDWRRRLRGLTSLSRPSSQ